jgi:hypothetical protein
VKRFSPAAAIGVFTLCAILGTGVGFRSKSPPKLDFKPSLETAFSSRGVQFTLSATSGKRFPKGLRITINLETPAGIVTTSGITGENAAFQLEVPYVRAGFLPFTIYIGDAVLHGMVNRKPGAAVNPLQLNVGARAVRISDPRTPALVLHPLDAQGNVSDDPILVRAARPDGTGFERAIRVQHLLAWTPITPGLRIGTLRIAAQAGVGVETNSSAEGSIARGERAEVDLQPGTVVTARFTATPNVLLSGTRDALSLRFQNARDAFGNNALDGSIAEFGTQGDWQLFAVRPLVRAEASLSLTPQLPPGQYRLSARGDGFRAISLPLRVTQPQFSGWQIRIERQTLVLGPLTDGLGAVLDDGTAVAIKLITSTTRLEETAALQNGRLTWRLPSLHGDWLELRVSVAGETKVLRGEVLRAKRP